MLNFKQYLSEQAKDDGFAPWHIRDPQKIQRFIQNGVYAHPDDFAYLKDGSIRCKKNKYYTDFPKSGCVETTNGKLGMPFKINSFGSDLYIRSSYLTDIQGIPTKGEKLKVEFDELTSFEGLNASYTHFQFKCQNLTSFNCKVKCKSVYLVDMKSFDMKDFINSFEGNHGHGITVSIETNTSSFFYRKPILSLLKIKPFLERLHIYSPFSIKTNQEQMEELMKVANILEKHAKSKDIISCQEELMDAGLGDYAKL